MLIRLKEGAGNRDTTALHHGSHALKSSSATIGDYSLAARCERLELLAREGLVPDPTSSVEAIAIEYRRAEAALITRLTGLELVQSDPALQIAAPSPHNEKPREETR